MNSSKTFRYFIVLIVVMAAAKAKASLPAVLLLIYMITHLL